MSNRSRLRNILRQTEQGWYDNSRDTYRKRLTVDPFADCHAGIDQKLHVLRRKSLPNGIVYRRRTGHGGLVRSLNREPREVPRWRTKEGDSGSARKAG